MLVVLSSMFAYFLVSRVIYLCLCRNYVLKHKTICNTMEGEYACLSVFWIVCVVCLPIMKFFEVFTPLKWLSELIIKDNREISD